jgi:hypothetical protein
MTLSNPSVSLPVKRTLRMWNADDAYFRYTIDGTPYEVASADALASLQFNDTFKIFAGADGGRSVC